MLARLKSINKDILFLENQKFSFGEKTKKNVKSPVLAIDTGITHTICGVPVHIYYYGSKNTLVYTPGQVHTMYSKNYEGQHHPMCKIKLPAYVDYIINEGGVKWKGDTVIFSTEDLENNDPDVYNDDMLAALVLACFYSLHQRLHYYMKRIEDEGLTINPGHNLAPLYTFDKINSILLLFKNPNVKKCVENVINTFTPINKSQLGILFEEIKYFSNEADLNSSKRKQFIIEMYHALMERKPFTKPRIPFGEPDAFIKPRRLF